jgi:hypothetical protein
MQKLNILNLIRTMRKSTKLIVVLLFLNALTFSFVLSRTKSQQTNENQTEQIVNQNKYIKAGTLVIDWSYRMLHYFKN